MHNAFVNQRFQDMHVENCVVIMGLEAPPNNTMCTFKMKS